MAHSWRRSQKPCCGMCKFGGPTAKQKTREREAQTASNEQARAIAILFYSCSDRTSAPLLGLASIHGCAMTHTILLSLVLPLTFLGPRQQDLHDLRLWQLLFTSVNSFRMLYTPLAEIGAGAYHLAKTKLTLLLPAKEFSFPAFGSPLCALSVNCNWTISL